MYLFKTVMLTIGLCLLFNRGFSQPHIQTNPISLALANCDATLSNPLSGFDSPAGLANIETTGCSVLGERRFNIKELNTAAAAIAIRTPMGTWGLCGSRMGFSTWQSSRYATSYSRTFGEKISAGFQLNYWQEYQANAGSFSNITSQFAIIYLPIKNFSVGVNVLNPEQSKINYGDFSMPLPSFINVGAAWKPISTATLYLEMDQPVNTSARIATAIEGRIYSTVFVRGGYSFTQQQISAGMGIHLNPMQFNIAFLSNQPLGWISSASVSWMF